MIDQDADTTLVHLTPVTGRSHQLRVHMQSIGHPIVGDSLYATGDALAFSSRLALQSHALSFSSPKVNVNDKSAQLSFVLPADF